MIELLVIAGWFAVLVFVVSDRNKNDRRIKEWEKEYKREHDMEYERFKSNLTPGNYGPFVAQCSHFLIDGHMKEHMREHMEEWERKQK